ncbi:MAG TPA: methyl-accepting chemotaxis protein [Gemmatimonadales bacterium]|nr:methyl-accepting chemotaxis protein [Gemmatimonadales bacterium]
MRTSLGARLLRLARVAGVIPVALLLGLTLLLAWRLDVRLARDLERDSRARLAGVSDGVMGLLKSQHEALQQTLLANLNVAEDVVRRRGGLGVSGGAVAWNAKNQLSGEIRTVALPALTVGGQSLGQNRNRAVTTPVVDEVARLVGGTVTVFQRMAPGDDMLRVATNVVTGDGQRAIGTYIPAKNADGSPNPVIAAVLAGHRYEGRAFVVDAWYQTVYEPITQGGRVIGMLYVGVRQENVASLRRSIVDARVGATGRVVVLGGSGTQRGHFVIATDSAANGSDALAIADAGGKPVYGLMVDSALRAAPGSVSLFRYTRALPGGGSEARIAGVSYFAPWDWVVIAEAPAAEFQVALDTTRATILQLILALLLTGALVAWGTVAYVRRAAIQVTGPVESLARAAERLAQGDLSVEVVEEGDEEIAQLGRSMQRIVAAEQKLAGAASAMARGDLGVEVTSRGERDTLGQAMEAILAAEREVEAAATRVASGDLARDLQERSDHDRLCQAMNAILRTERELSAVLERVAAGDLSVSVAARSPEDRLSRAVDRIVRAEQALAQAAGRIAAGDLSVEVAPRSAHDALGLAFGQILEAERRLSQAAERIAAGDVSAPVASRGPQDILGQAFVRLQQTIHALAAETGRLIAAASAGTLGIRGETSQFTGEFHALVEGINRLLDASSGPLQEAAGVLGGIAAHDLTRRMQGRYQGDHAAFAADVNRMAADLSASMGSIANTAIRLAQAAGDLRVAGETVARSAEVASSEAGTVAAEARGVSGTVQSVAAGAEEMTASIREIAEGATSAARVAGSAVEVARRADQTMERLRESSGRISEIVRTITEIAQQTNLLALNATIEAARAGEAGKGFAGVATEVKDLAGHTGRATDEIGRRVEEIQRDARDAVEALRQISGIISEISGLSTSIAGAVEEQTATTSEMTRGIAGAAQGVDGISSRIDVVADAAGRSNEAIARSQGAVTSVLGIASELRTLVEQFRYDSRGEREGVPAGLVPASSPAGVGR